MNLWELKEKVINKNLPNLLIFITEEPTLSDIYIKQIASNFNNNYISMDSIYNYLNFQSQKNIFNQNFDMVVIRDDKAILEDENIWSRLDKLNQLLILSFNKTKEGSSKIKIDSKSKFYKRFEDNIIIFEKMSTDIIKTSLLFSLNKSNIKLDEAYIDWLINACNGDYGRCLNELDKLLIFKDSPVNHQELFRQFIKDGVIHEDISDCIFDYTNAFLDRKIKDVYKKYEELKETDDVPFRVLKTLQNSFRLLLLIQSSRNPTAESCGIKEARFYALKNRPKKYNVEEIKNILILISEIDRNIKLGLIDDTMALEYLMVKVL